jgi:hypothetical protein
MNFHESKYLLLLSQQLEGFKQVRENVYNFRCPFCGDSKKTKFKSRGYVYPNKDGRGRFKCHNCGDSRGIPDLLKELSPNLYHQYKMESFHSTNKSQYTSVKVKTVTKTVSVADEVIKHFRPLSQANNEVVDYAKRRKIPQKFFPYLYSANSLNDITKYIPYYSHTQFPNFPVLMIPFFTWDRNFDYIVCRTIDPDRKDFRFTTLEIISGGLKIWGLPFINWEKDILVFEGAIDAMFAKNSLAFGSASNYEAERWLLTKKSKEEICYCFDNDYSKNPEVKKIVEAKIESGFRVLMYNKEFKWKDLNEAAMKGNWTQQQIQEYINKRTFHNLRARLELGTR